MADVLCVVAHPDDESFGAGAHIAWLADRHNVMVVALSDGVGSRGVMVVEEDGTIVQADRRRQHFERACVVLGVEHELRHLFPDQRSDTVAQLLINREVEELVKQHTPSQVITHHVGDLNIDHRRVAEAVLVATRGGPEVMTMAPEWPDRCVGRRWNPKVYPLGSLDKKMAACACYEDEIRTYPHPRSMRAIVATFPEGFMEIR